MENDTMHPRDKSIVEVYINGVTQQRKCPKHRGQQKAFKRLALRHLSPTSPLSFQSTLGCLDISRSSAKPNASGIRDKQRSPSYQLWNRLPSPCRPLQTHLNELASVSAYQSEQSQKPYLHLDLAPYILLCVRDKRRPEPLVPREQDVSWLADL